MNPIILANRLYVPQNLVSEADLERVYEQHAFVETVCRNCPIFKKGDRPSQRCYTCTGDTPGAWNGYTGFFKQWHDVNISNKPYYSLPVGDLREAETELNLSLETAKDVRAHVPMDVPISFIGKLYTGREIVGGKKMANQIGIVKTFWRIPGRSGVIQAPPRTGKTVLGAFFATAFKYKTLIIAHEKILLDQFEAEIRRFTDVNQQERLAGRKLLKIAKTEKDLSGNYEILLVNYQKLISELGIRRVVKHLQKRFGLLIVDEIHRCGTQHYEDLLNRIDPAHRIGFSATPRRKDGKDFTFRRSLGPTVVVAKTDTLKPKVYVKITKYALKKEYRGRPAYVRTCSWLAENQERNIEIVKQAFVDLRANPKHLIVIPVMKIIHARTLVAMINKQARINYEKRGEAWPQPLAEMLWRESDKKQVIADIKARRFRVLVAIQKFVKEGTNIPQLTHFYSIFPQNNTVATEQGTARILTPLDGKPDPVLRYFVDPISICISCFRNTNVDSLIPLKYTMAEETKPTVDYLMSLVRNPKTGKWEEPTSSEEMLSMW